MSRALESGRRRKLNKRNRELNMQSDKAFFTYAAALLLGIIAVLVFLVHQGEVPYPSFGFLIVHIVLSLIVRWAYKSWDGPRNVDEPMGLEQ
jgi:hypothetical protein